ncbi:MAG: methyltransferase [Candidatus Aenigmarchaeota archaeon]|nr:methyltransferase [Candidatus Aenigmarchaeota archaeon]
MNLHPISKGALSIVLSQLKLFDEPKVRLEQYPTDSQVAAELLWTAFQLGDIQNKTIADFGAGCGILGIGALLLGAKEVFFVESEKKALSIAQKNLHTVMENHHISGNASFVLDSVINFSKPVDCVIQNPPFGTREKGADILFLKAAFLNAPIIYSFHKTITRNYIQKVSSTAEYTVTHIFPYQLPLKATLAQHTRKIHRIDVTAFRLEKQKVYK